MAKMNLARLKGMLAGPTAPIDPLEPDADDQARAPVQAPPQRKSKGKVKRKLFGKAKLQDESDGAGY